jgi:3-isopropylmalate dehydrogenase
MDLIVVRENTEGFYSDRNMFAGTGEFMPDPDLALSIRKVSATACRAVAHAAFELAQDRRKKVTAVHKANVLKLSDGLFLREIRKVAADYPDVELEELIVDATAALLIRRPQTFDVIVTTNMFGDILSDEASELSGSLGLGGSISTGEGICVAQAQHLVLLLILAHADSLDLRLHRRHPHHRRDRRDDPRRRRAPPA